MEVSMSRHVNINHNLSKLTLFSKNNRKAIISCQLVAMQSGKSSNFYELLSLSSQNVGFDEIKKAYKTLALQYHPDVCDGSVITKEESTKRFIELRKAYETLSDPNARRVYDYELMGLEDPFGFGACFRDRVEKTREGCLSRDMLERQLSELRKKSAERMNKRRSYN